MSSLWRLTFDDLQRLHPFWVERWGGEEMITRGNIYRPEQLDGFVIEDGKEWLGLLTFYVEDNECEVTSLDSLREGQGVGTELMDAVVEEARKQDRKRLFLVTTNENMHALRFYQKRGFELVTIYRGSVIESRKVKPSIPLIGFDDIPLRDEIELELSLK